MAGSSNEIANITVDNKSYQAYDDNYRRKVFILIIYKGSFDTRVRKKMKVTPKKRDIVESVPVPINPQ